MAQHDYNIANQSFPSFRTDLNNVLSAVNSSNSGTSRPSGAVAGTIWLDTTSATTPTLKYYDGADDISLATLDHTTNTVNWLDSTVVADLLNDTSPQLGGDLDLNSSDITGTGNINITGTVTATTINGTIENVVEDTTPQLGGDLDVNGNDIVSTSNADINISPNGTGRVTLGASKIEQVAEKVTNGATAFSGTINFDVITQAVFRATSNASGNWTLNIRGDGSNSLDSIMDTGESITIVTIVPQGGTAYYNTAVQVDGSGVTPKWQGGDAPSEGNSSSDDVYSYTVVKTGSATFVVYASQTQFA